MMDQFERDQIKEALVTCERGLELLAAGMRQLMDIVDQETAPAANANDGVRANERDPPFGVYCPTWQPRR